MKNLIRIVLVLVTIASVGYGYYQSVERSRLELLLEQATAQAEQATIRAEQAIIRAEQAAMEAHRQQAIARAQRDLAEKAATDQGRRR